MSTSILIFNTFVTMLTKCHNKNCSPTSFFPQCYKTSGQKLCRVHRWMGNQKFPYRGVWHAEQGIGNCFNIFDFRLHSAQYRKIDKFVFFKTPSPVPPCLPRRQCNKFINFELRFPLGAGQSNVHYRIVLLHFNILFDYCQGFFGKIFNFFKNFASKWFVHILWRWI